MSITDAWAVEEKVFWEMMAEKEYPPIPLEKRYRPKRFQALANAQRERQKKVELEE